MSNAYLFEIIVTPRDGTTGLNLLRVLEILQVCIRAPLLFVADVECNGNRSWAQQAIFQTTTDELFRYVQSVGEFDWASFFFFEELTGISGEKQDYETLFAKAALVVQVVDDTYFYVYSADVEDVEHLADFFTVQADKKRRDEVIHPA
jgi:hypothetical protein